MHNILVTGADGQLANSLSRVCENIDGLVYFATRKDLDLLNPSSIEKMLSSLKPEYIINCAAYTAVDKAEAEEELAFQVNRDGVVNLIKASEAYQSKIIHISTDYVFNGEAKKPYKVNDVPDPRSVYGRSKAAGEKALNEFAPNRSIIIRTSWLYSEFGHNFLKTMLRLGAERTSLNVVQDQIGIPTYAKDLADAIVSLIKLNIEITKDNRILHFSNANESSWFEFAKEIMKLAELDCKINPITTSAYPTAAKRPAYSVLDTSRFENLVAYSFRPWKEALADCISTLKKA
jgi:dTDP-4-dehydrorhamnose reductase